MLVYGIPSYKLEKDVVAAEIEVIEAMGVTIKTGVEVGKDVTLEELRAQAIRLSISPSVVREEGRPACRERTLTV